MELGDQNYIELGDHKVGERDFTQIWKAKEPTRVILTVPHDVLPNLEWPDELRSTGVRGGDRLVWPLAKRLLFEQGDLTIPKSISVVRGLMSRGMVDLNRGYPIGLDSWTDDKNQPALENPQYAFVYNYYHSLVDYLVSEAVSYYGSENCLLIDLHGFKRQPTYAPESGYDLILGTGNRSSILHGDPDIQFGEFMRSLGYCVFLPQNDRVDPTKEDEYSGGFTTRHYSRKFGINAIQIETAPWFRYKDKTKARGPQLSRDLALFLDKYFTEGNSNIPILDQVALR